MVFQVVFISTCGPVLADNFAEGVKKKHPLKIYNG